MARLLLVLGLALVMFSQIAKAHRTVTTVGCPKECVPDYYVTDKGWRKTISTVYNIGDMIENPWCIIDDEQ